MVTQRIIKKIPFSYQTLQRIKANEYLRFFSNLDEYYLCVNHLGEIQWMTEEEVDRQHEFFLHEGNPSGLLKGIFYTSKTPNLSAVPEAEKEIRLQLRVLLEETYLGGVTPETKRLIPTSWRTELKKEELIHIPITLEILQSRDWKKPAILATIAITAIIAALVILYFLPESKTGKLIVQTNVEGGRIFIDEGSFLGYSGSVIQYIPVGLHRVSVNKNGYVAVPKSQDVQIRSDSTQLIQFELKPLDSNVLGGLKIIAEQKDSDLFLNGDYYGKIGDFPMLTLEQGSYQIEIKKAGYITVPSEQMVSIAAGDTTTLILEQVLASRQKAPRSAVTTGNLEITSNISGAQIYLNGKETGRETDYVFTNLPLGQYAIQVSKEGYGISPEEQTVRLTSSQPLGEAAFHLSKNSEVVTVETDHPNAGIFVDGEKRGVGKLHSQLSIGKHEISFGSIEGFNAPSTKNINVKPRLPINIKVKYFPQMRILAEITNNGNMRSQDCNVLSGYTFGNKGFSPSDEAGPEVVYNENIKNYYWKLGFAYPLRNPKGNDAIQLVFRLPHELDYEQKFTLKIDAAISKDSYPLTLSRKVDISIKFNNNILSYYYQPKVFEEVGRTEPMEWDITAYIKPSSNILEIATTEKNNAYYFLKRILIHN